MSLGRARLDGDSLYGEARFSLLGEVAAGLCGKDMVLEEGLVLMRLSTSVVLYVVAGARLSSIATPAQNKSLLQGAEV